jgi:hypothetical protein
MPWDLNQRNQGGSKALQSIGNLTIAQLVKETLLGNDLMSTRSH